MLCTTSRLSLSCSAIASVLLAPGFCGAQQPTPAPPRETPEVIEPASAPEDEGVTVAAPQPGVVPANPVEPIPVVHAASGPVCCPIEVVDVRVKRSARSLYRCHGPAVETSVCVDNPADLGCTLYEVPLCVPCCCVGAPQVCNPRHGLLPGRGKVDLVWDCGFAATVTFLKHGGVIVTYSAG